MKFMSARRTFVLAVVTVLAAAPSVGGRQVTNPTLLSVSVTPAGPTVAAGALLALTATGAFSDASTRTLGSGGVAPQVHVLFEPNLDVTACAPDVPPPWRYCCQSVSPAPDGSFHEIWAPSRPNTLRVDGTISGTVFTAALSCAGTGTQTGSLNATWNGTHYSGTFTFGNTGSLLVKKLSWSSSDTAVATVDATGMVTGVSPGPATITATFGSTCWAGSPEPPGGCAGTVAGATTVTVVPAAGPPAAPVNFTAVASGNAVRFSWTPPSTGTPPNGYELIARQAPGSPVLGTAPVGNVTSVTISVPNGNFFVTVRGSNPQGTGVESSGVVVTLPAPIIPPDPPRTLTFSVNGDALSLSWLPPANSPPGIGYTVMASLTPGGAAAGTIGLGAGHTHFAVNRVPVGTYYLRVVATNEGGASLPSNEVTVTVAPPQRPAAPTIHAAQVTGSVVTLSWTPAATGGVPTSYVLTSALTAGGPAIATLPVNGTSIGGPVPPGTYFIHVAAVNAGGASAPSNEILVTVP